MTKTFYNENDAFPAQWMRNLASAGHISQGVVDETDIRFLRPEAVAGFSRAHFFAGIGLWDYALNRAGWPYANTWTGSCPCQPFSQAGEGKGFDDPRHLWPDWFRLIRVCRPDFIFGEQVSGPDGARWFDLVQSDLEGIGYTCGAIVAPAAGVGAPNIRHRIFWVAYTQCHGQHRGGNIGAAGWPQSTDFGAASRLVHAHGGHTGAEGLQRSGEHRQQQADDGAGGLADSGSARLAGRAQQYARQEQPPAERSGHAGGMADPTRVRHRPHGLESFTGRWQQSTGPNGRDVVWEQPGPVNGVWANADWIYCTDGKWRPVESGTFPLAHGYPQRVGRLRAYGNAINPEVAIPFIQSVMDLL